MGQEQRKRRSGPKVKTGCRTCKIRRIKCDETKPNCQRCSTTGRKCDGYSSIIGISSETPKNSTSLIQRISVHIPGTAEDRRVFEFFLRNTAAELSGYYNYSFWERLVLSASAQKPALRHAVIALGALHGDFTRKRLASSSLSADDQQTSFASTQHMKAIGALRRSLSNGTEEPLTALMCCILSVCFESLRGWFESAKIHLQSGLKILRDVKRSSKSNHIIENDILPLLTRLSMQSVIYINTKPTHEQIAFAGDTINIPGKDIVVSKSFGSIEEARNALDQAANGIFGLLYILDGKLPVGLQPPDTLALLNKYTSQLSLWNSAFECFMAAKGENLTTGELRGAALLKIHYTTARIMVCILPDISDVTPIYEAMKPEQFSEYLGGFQIVVNLSRTLIAASEQDVKNGKPPLIIAAAVEVSSRWEK